jgi:hypothetical protein
MDKSRHNLSVKFIPELSIEWLRRGFAVSLQWIFTFVRHVQNCHCCAARGFVPAVIFRRLVL